MTKNTNRTWFRRCLALGLLLGASAHSSASVTLNYQFISPELTVGTKCLLVASTQDADLGQPGDLAGVPLVAGATFGQDNVVLAVLTAEDLPGSRTGVSGMLTLNYTGQLDAGDPVTLIWLPGLPAIATVMPLGSGFVSFRADVPADGGTIAYALPTDGSTDSLYSIANGYGGSTIYPNSVPAIVATYPHDLDTDGDQIGDLLEFAMGLDPYGSSTAYQPMLAYGNAGADLTLDFALRDDLALHNLAVTVESSLTLHDGSWFSVNMQPSQIAGRWEVVVPAPTGANARQFFRFKLDTP